MKRLNNILSYLWSLLLFLTLTTCSDWEEIVVTMQMEEEVELTIQTEISGMKGSTRTAPTENITAITAYAFDSNSQLIKEVKAILSDDNKQATSGNLRIKVPKRTGDIHFIAKNNAESPDVTISIGDNVSTLLSQTTDELHYWGKTTFDGTNATLPVTLYRNMAKVTLEAGNDDYIAGFLNYNTSGNIVPYSNEGFDFGSKKNYITLPYGVASTSHDGTNESLGTEHYLFEHANEKNNNPLYAICNIGGKYYKIAFAYTNNGSVTYFDIIRNNAYKIVISDIDELYGEDSFKNAKNENTQPINDLVITEGVALNITANPGELPTTQDGTCSVIVAIPEGITELMVDADAVFTVTSDEVTLTDGKCDVNGKETVTFTLTVNANATTGDKKVSFSGRGKYMTATGSTTIRLYENATLSISPTSVYNTAGSTTTVSVPIPQGITSLTATSEAFTVTSNEVSLNNGSFDVSGKQGQSVNFTLTLKDGGVGTVGDTRTVTFSGSGDYKRATGTATVTLAEAPAQGSLPVYELWFEENNGWNGSTDYATFFTKNGDITTGNGNARNMEDTFYDGTFIINDVTYSGADNHRSYAMTMGDGKSIGFTITEPRWLTLLVARSGNAPSINLTGTLTDGTWATAGNTEDLTNGTYNFAAEGEITTAGRLIRYTLPAGTYTLQRGNNDYLLYYMRVSTSKPTMTDIVQPAAGDYSLSWSGNNGGYLKDPNNDAKYFVDEEATNFTPTLTYNGLSKVSLSTVKLDVTTDVWTFVNEDDSSEGSMQQYTSNYTEANISSLEYNEGAYTLSGSVTGISGTSYKYARFYDNLQLKLVSFNVKNTVKVALYNSWDADAQPVTEFVEGGENNILGFKMPQHTLPVNPLNSEKINFTIDNSWQLNQSGAGIYQVGDSNYQIGDQANQNQQEGIHYHPRTEWTYKMSWNNIPLNTITPTSTTDDVYFSYNGIVSKNPTITTQAAETPLSIELDFYQTEGENLGNNATYNLALGETSFYLKATIEADDAADYAGKTVTLNNAFSGNGYQWENSNGAIHWVDSSIDNNSNINSNGDATQLSFIVDANTTEYVIEWVFVTGQYYKGGDIGFAYSISTYTISDVSYNNIDGDKSATIAFTDEPIYLDVYSDADTDAGNDISIVSGSQLVMKATLSSDIAPGTQITFDLSESTGDIMSGITWNDRAGQSVQFSWPNITLSVVENQRDYYLYWNPTVSDECSATLNFTVSGNYNLNSVGNTSYSKTVTVTPNNNQTTGTVVWSEGKTYTEWSTEYIAVNTYIPTGSVITIYTSSTNGGAFEMHDIEERSLRFTNVNYPVNDDNYYSVASGETSHSFTVTNETTANGKSLDNGVDGLKINGNNVTITRIVVQYPSMTGEVFNRDFEDESTINGWGDNVERRNDQEGENHYLVLANTSGGFAQASLDRAYVPGNYTLTYKIKGNASDSISQVFQYFNDNQSIYESVVGSQSVEFGTDDWTIVTLDFEVTRGCNRLLFDYSDFTGEIYIDDLRLVKND